MGKDRREQIPREDSVAYLPTTVPQWHSSERVRGKAFIRYLTLEGGSFGGNLQTM